LRHGYFRELCAAASIGLATGEELSKLEAHAAECDGCRQTYFDFLNVASQEFAAAKESPTLSAREFEECLNSELFTRRFFDRAKREGIVFSKDVDENLRPPVPIPFAFSKKPWWQKSAIPMAATMIFALMISGGYIHWRHSLIGPRASLGLLGSHTVRTETSATADDARVRVLTTANLELQGQVDRLSNQLRRANEELLQNESDNRATSQDRRALAVDRDTIEAALEQAKQELAQSESVAANAQQEASAQRQHAGEIEATLIADQVRLHDLEEELKGASATLDQERQLLSSSHDVTDLMGARNLHIVDVVDTDPRGKPRPAFGRIFFTEDKSLIFYAYDFNEQKMQRANYQYQVWAKKEGQNQRSQRLGIFYSDDKTQRRWVFRCDDPKILREIDSVFVTFGRPDSDPSHPEGTSLMYAYLRGQPNHP
jgi:hypothetical protein